MAELVSLKRIASILNFPEDEVMEMVRQKRIPNIYFPRREEYLFPREEVLSRIAPRPTEESAKKEPVAARRGRPKK